jgi:hypothetical protein
MAGDRVVLLDARVATVILNTKVLTLLDLLAQKYKF